FKNPGCFSSILIPLRVMTKRSYIVAVFFSYFFVVLIWATTPLAIQWSSDSVSFSMAVVLRMGLALIVALVIHVLFRRTLFSHDKAGNVYLAASIGIFPNMPLVY